MSNTSSSCPMKSVMKAIIAINIYIPYQLCHKLVEAGTGTCVSVEPTQKDYLITKVLFKSMLYRNSSET